MPQKLPPEEGYFFYQLADGENYQIYSVSVNLVSRTWGEGSAEFLIETLNLMNLGATEPLTEADTKIIAARFVEAGQMVAERRRKAAEDELPTFFDDAQGLNDGE